MIDAQGQSMSLSMIEYQQKTLSTVLNDERDDLINNFTFWRDCLPDDAKGAQQQLNAVIAFIQRRKPKVESDDVVWSDGTGNML